MPRYVALLQGINVGKHKRVAALAEAERGDDDYRVVSADVLLSCPTTLTGATFMPAGLGKALGVDATSRNWRTVTRLAEMARP